MGFFSKGNVHMDVIVDRQAYAPGSKKSLCTGLYVSVLIKKKKFLKKGAHPSSCLQALNPQRCRLKNIKGQHSSNSNLLYYTDCGAVTNIQVIGVRLFIYLFSSKEKKNTVSQDETYNFVKEL